MSGSANVAAWSGTIGFAILFAGAAVAAAISYGLIFLLMPLLRRHAQASPNARSSHKIPTTRRWSSRRRSRHYSCGGDCSCVARVEH